MSLPSPPACGRGDGGGGDRCNAPFAMRRAPCYRRRVMANTPDDLSSSAPADSTDRSEEHTSELQSLMRISYAVFCLKKKTKHIKQNNTYNTTNITTIKPH